MMPVIELKYHNDLYETTETFNKYCLNNDIELLNELDVKDTYMWNMTNYLYDFDTVDTYLNDESQNTYKIQSITVDNGGSGYKSEPTVKIVSNDDKGSGASAKAVLTTTGAVSSITVDNGGSGYKSVPNVVFAGGGGSGASAKAVIVPEVSDYKWLPEMNSKIYLYYLNMSMAFFLIIIAFFCYSFFYIFKYHLEEHKICMYGDTDADVNDFFRYYLYVLAIYILLFITFFSIILKKITEIYKTTDTETYEYIILMKGLDTILKENKITNADNKEIIDILKKHSKNKINDIRYVAIHNKDAMYDLAVAVKKKGNPRDNAKTTATTTTITESDIKNNYENAEGKLIRLNNIDRLEYYNSDEAKNKVKGKVADIFRFIYAYIFFLIVPIYLLSVSLKGNYIYLLFTLIIMIVFSISVYNIYNTLQ
jgi:hypothetical protein